MAADIWNISDVNKCPTLERITHYAFLFKTLASNRTFTCKQ